MIKLKILTQVLSFIFFFQYISFVLIGTFLNTTGIETEMTVEEEQLLAEGKNFEHSAGSVTTG